MRIVHATFHYPDRNVSEEELLQQYYTIVGWAEALQRIGNEVIVMMRFGKENSFQKNNVQYHFIKDRFGPLLRNWHLPFTFFKRINQLDADVIHLHHLSFSIQTFFLRQLLGTKTAIAIQHHGGPNPKGIKKSFHDKLNGFADGYFFTTIEQGQQWFKNKNQQQKIMPVMEGATFFNYNSRDLEKSFDYADRNTARKKTGLIGNPAFLWVGRLDENKDPLTVLEGFEILCKKHENANLYMIYSEANLVNEVKRKINNSEILENKVHLLGKIAHEEIENYYNSADYFVLGSHYEGSGYALSEALKCGCVPIVTKIPSFKMMTNNGQLGVLWEPSDKNSFAEAATLAITKPLEQEAKTCIEFFKNNLSFDAIAETATKHYQIIIERRRQKIK